MTFKSPAIRLSIALTLLAVNLIFLADQLGFIPDPSASALALRKALSESLALQFAGAAKKGDLQTIRDTLRLVVERNEDIRSAAIRTIDGNLIAMSGEHLAYWRGDKEGKSTPTHVQVPVYRKNEKWAMVEIRFAPIWTGSRIFGLSKSLFQLLIFIGLSSFLCYFLLTKRTLRELDPAKVIPERVQKAFDVLQEGVLILDEKEQIVLANRSFAAFFGRAPNKMLGLKGSELGWLNFQSTEQIRQLPWFKVLAEGREHAATTLSLIDHQGRKIKFAVNMAVLTDQTGGIRGTLLTFDDITQLEEKNFELGQMLEKLQAANEEIQEKSRALEDLANRDPLTRCLNRRCLGQLFEQLFAEAKSNEGQLSCIMVDIDFFKSVNDRYGHSTGDQVIKMVADVLKTCTREADLVGRYGGEEFCLVLPALNLDKAAKIAERIRRAIEEKTCSGIKITVSLGVASLESDADTPEALVNQADKALYSAKESGRNRVVTWGKDDDAAAQLEQLPEADAVHAAASPVGQDVNQLQRRVKELEGLLEKRTMQIEHHEMYDLKTGLPNRSLFEDRISQEIARAKRKNCLVAVLSMSVSTIKRIHETLGTRVAGQLVKACGRRVNDVIRGNVDTVAVIGNIIGMPTVSLINETEFGILLTDIQQTDHVTWVMKRLLDAFEQPFQIKGQEIYASVYFGVAIFPHDGQTAEALYASAANACSYARKLDGKDRYLFASENLNRKATNDLKIENYLHKAIEKNELQLHYQPKIDSATGRIAGFEALLRWHNDQLGMVPPDKFIPVAERSGQINRIGDWVLVCACRQLRTWLDAGLKVIPVAINISGIQLRQPNLADRIGRILKKYNLDRHLLEIELTESSLINAGDQPYVMFSQIKEMGIRVTMDDFGTGYSSLSYLRRMPLSCLKIDRSFIADINKDENADKLIASIVSMAHEMGLEVVAEGVEEKYQVDHLIELGCEYLQGYYYSRPVPRDEAEKLLQEQALALTG